MHQRTKSSRGVGLVDTDIYFTSLIQSDISTCPTVGISSVNPRYDIFLKSVVAVGLFDTNRAGPSVTFHFSLLCRQGLIGNIDEAKGNRSPSTK